MTDATPPVQPAAPTNVLAIVSLVLSVIGLGTFVTAIGGVITGHIAIAQIARTGEGGRGFAVAALIVGYAVIVLGIVLGLLFFGGLFVYSSFGR